MIEWHYRSHNSSSDSASPRKVLPWIFASAKGFPPAVIFILQFSMVFSKTFITSSDIFYILRQCIILFCGIKSYAFLLLVRFSVSFCYPWVCVDQYIVVLLLPLFPCSILSVLQGRKYPPWFVSLVLFTSSVDTLWDCSCWGKFLWNFFDQCDLSFGHSF